MTTKITFEIFNDTDTKQIDVKYEEFCKWVVDFSKGDYLEKIICPKNDIKLYLTQSWLNYTEEKQYHHNLSHLQKFCLKP